MVEKAKRQHCQVRRRRSGGMPRCGCARQTKNLTPAQASEYVTQAHMDLNRPAMEHQRTGSRIGSASGQQHAGINEQPTGNITAPPRPSTTAPMSVRLSARKPRLTARLPAHRFQPDRPGSPAVA